MFAAANYILLYFTAPDFKHSSVCSAAIISSGGWSRGSKRVPQGPEGGSVAAFVSRSLVSHTPPRDPSPVCLSAAVWLVSTQSKRNLLAFLDPCHLPAPSVQGSGVRWPLHWNAPGALGVSFIRESSRQGDGQQQTVIKQTFVDALASLAPDLKLQQTLTFPSQRSSPASSQRSQIYPPDGSRTHRLLTTSL